MPGSFVDPLMERFVEDRHDHIETADCKNVAAAAVGNSDGLGLVVDSPGD